MKTIYSNLHFYKILTAEIKDTSSTSTVDWPVDWPVDYKYFKAVTRLSMVGVVFGGVSMLANLLLLWAFFDSKHPRMAYPYFFWKIFNLLYTFGVTTFFIAIWTDGFPFIFLGNILGWPLSIYFIIVVYSYIETLHKDPSAFDMGPVVSVPMQMQPPPYAKLQEVTAE